MVSGLRRVRTRRVCGVVWLGYPPTPRLTYVASCTYPVGDEQRLVAEVAVLPHVPHDAGPGDDQAVAGAGRQRVLLRAVARVRRDLSLVPRQLLGGQLDGGAQGHLQALMEGDSTEDEVSQ